MTQPHPESESKLGAIVLLCEPDSYFSHLVRTHNGWLGGATMWLANFLAGGFGAFIGVLVLLNAIAFCLNAVGVKVGTGGPPLLSGLGKSGALALLVGLGVVGALVIHWLYGWAWKKQRLQLHEHGIRYRQIFRRAWKDVGFDELAGIQVGAPAPVLSALEELGRVTNRTMHEAVEVNRRTSVVFRLRDGTEVKAKNLTMAYSPVQLDEFWRATREFFPEVVVHLT